MWLVKLQRKATKGYVLAWKAKEMNVKNLETDAKILSFERNIGTSQQLEYGSQCKIF